MLVIGSATVAAQQLVFQAPKTLFSISNCGNACPSYVVVVVAAAADFGLLRWCHSVATEVLSRGTTVVVDASVHIVRI